MIPLFTQLKRQPKFSQGVFVLFLSILAQLRFIKRFLSARTIRIDSHPTSDVVEEEKSTIYLVEGNPAPAESNSKNKQRHFTPHLPRVRNGLRENLISSQRPFWAASSYFQPHNSQAHTLDTSQHGLLGLFQVQVSEGAHSCGLRRDRHFCL